MSQTNPHRNRVPLSPELAHKLGIHRSKEAALEFLPGGDWTIVQRAPNPRNRWHVYVDPIDKEMFDLLDDLADHYRPLGREEVN